MLTARIAPQDELPDLVVDEDEEAIGEGTEPPSDPAPNRKESVSGASLVVKPRRLWTPEPGSGGPRWGHTHLSGYMRRATPMPGQ